MKNINIAVDGPAGAGKSTISRAVAKKLGFIYVDTGAMYRACALYAIENGLEIRYTDAGQRIYLCGRDVSERIREPDVSIGASDIATIPQVRIKLVELQRELARGNNVIMDGRDIGTYVLPDADVKIFLTASVEERARRRFDELKAKAVQTDFEQVRRDMQYRDKNDSEREFAPLRRAEDAVLIDTTELDFDAAVEAVLGAVASSQKRKDMK